MNFARMNFMFGVITAVHQCTVGSERASFQFLAIGCFALNIHSSEKIRLPLWCIIYWRYLHFRFITLKSAGILLLSFDLVLGSSPMSRYHSVSIIKPLLVFLMTFQYIQYKTNNTNFFVGGINFLRWRFRYLVKNLVGIHGLNNYPYFFHGLWLCGWLD